MHGLRILTIASCLTCCSAHLGATTVFCCEDGNGHITFTQQGCPPQQNQDLQDAHNPTPGTGKPVAMATNPKPAKRNKDGTKPSKGSIVVGEHQDGCGNRVTGAERRTAMIRDEARAGMTKADVESALGKPDKVTSQNGHTRYHYKDAQGNRRQVSFDQAGCVKGKP